MAYRQTAVCTYAIGIYSILRFKSITKQLYTFSISSNKANEGLFATQHRRLAWHKTQLNSLATSFRGNAGSFQFLMILCRYIMLRQACVSTHTPWHTAPEFRHNTLSQECMYTYTLAHIYVPQTYGYTSCCHTHSQGRMYLHHIHININHTDIHAYSLWHAYGQINSCIPHSRTHTQTLHTSSAQHSHIKTSTSHVHMDIHTSLIHTCTLTACPHSHHTCGAHALSQACSQMCSYIMNSPSLCPHTGLQHTHTHSLSSHMQIYRITQMQNIFTYCNPHVQYTTVMHTHTAHPYLSVTYTHTHRVHPK